MFDLYTMIGIALAGLALILGVSILGTVGLLAAVVVLLIASTLWGAATGRRKALSVLRDPRFVRTDEVFLDHGTGRVMRVYADPKTGERRYVRD